MSLLLLVFGAVVWVIGFAFALRVALRVDRREAQIRSFSRSLDEDLDRLGDGSRPRPGTGNGAAA
jgi:hypothetical protein